MGSAPHCSQLLKGGRTLSINFDLSAFDHLDDTLAEKAARLENLAGSESAKGKIKAALKPITDDAKGRIHSLTGHLRDSVESRVTTYPDAPTEIEVGISYKRHKLARHAHLVEGGHGGPHPAPPHPFWEPAVQAHGQEAAQALEDTIGEMIDQVL